MARPQPHEQWSEPATAPGSTDWDTLRNDLEALLRQVENRQLHAETKPARAQEPPQRSFEPFAQPSNDPQVRHQAALRSVQKAVERFTEPARGFAASPRDDVQTAISEIRARTGEPQPQFAYADPNRTDRYRDEFEIGRQHVPLRSEPPEMHAQEDRRSDTVADLQKLTHAVSGMAGRLERLEADMRATRDASGDIAEIAAQVGQLTHVIELVAGAVGEQGHVKRLENQIADLARLYSEGPRPEITALTRRIDELSVTVDRLADLQVQEIGRATREAEGAASSQAETLRSQSASMRAIEDGVRNIYDRIDALEQTYAIAPDDIDRLTREMGSVTEALKHADDTVTLNGIVGKLDALSHRIDGMGQVGDTSVTALRDDVEALRDVVREAVEPRFAALESRLESLTSQVGSAAAPSTPSFAQLEEQIRRLAKSMDQTGQQLSGLTELYKSEAGREASPDLEALAALVAERTSEELARLKGGTAGLDESSLGALEARLSKLFSENRAAEALSLLVDVAKNLNRVDERLNRLETALEMLVRRETVSVEQKKAPAVAPPAGAPPGAAPKPPSPPASAPVARDRAPASAATSSARSAAAPVPPKPSFSDPAPMPRTTRQPQQADDMPYAPSLERPLVDDELSTLVAPVEDWSAIGLDEVAAPAARPQASGLPGFDASKIERPARPPSSFAEEAAGFTPLKDTGGLQDPDKDLESGTPSADRNTFIAAARRAVRNSHEAHAGADEQQSLIGRALARFQTGRKPAATVGPQSPAAPDPEPEFEPERHIPVLPVGKATLDDFPDDIDVLSLDRPGTKSKEGFLSRHRRSLLLAGALVVTTLLAVNLVVQRLAPPAMPGSAQVTSSPADTAPGGSSDAGNPLIDPIPTGSIDPDIKLTLAEPSPTRQILPSTLTPDPLPGAADLDPTFTHSVPPVETMPPETAPVPIKLDLPPEKIGPLELRQAAADGDPRAQFEVGAIYTEGSAITQDFIAAAKWYERAAAQGFAPAQYRLGNLYEHGNGVDKDLEEARLWYARAAEAGNRLAMHNLAALYASGDLGEQQFAAAAEWFERAAEAGMTDSQFNLGMLYARGLGVPQDLKASFKWFSLAAEAGDQDAAKARDDVSKSLNAADLDAVKTEIADWHMTPIDIATNFAPIGTWSKTFDPGQTITENEVTKNVQKALARLGYDPGTIDGVMGPKTTEAIKEFEKATGMNPTGLVNPRLLAVLGSQPV